MATITITKHLYVGTKNIVSVHNPNVLKWTFVPNVDTRAITSTVTYGMYVFNGILTDVYTGTTPNTFSFELDLTEILKYIATNYYHKALPSNNDGIINYSLIKKYVLAIKGNEDGSQTATSMETVYLSHGVNQVGNPNASTMADIYDNKTNKFYFFPGYPGEIYWWAGSVYDDQDIFLNDVFIQTEHLGGAYGQAGLAGVNLSNFASLLTEKKTHEIRIDDSFLIQVETLDSTCVGLYIRYLSREGFYRTWLFNRYYTIEQEQKKIGELTYHGGDMAARSYNMGYKDTFRSYIATSEGVRKDIRKQLMDLFTSPAVYLWNGKQGDADNENLWTLVDIEGSHQLIEKQEFANFTVTIKLPELYTQTL